MTKTGEAARPPLEMDAESLMDTLRLRQREITIGAIVVVVAVSLGWLWRSSSLRKETNGERALNLAASSYYAGNKPLAKTDLGKMIDRYSGTSAGVQGAMLLAQILYEEAKFEDGIKALQAQQGTGPARSFAASLEALIASGYSDQKKYEEAGKHFLAAADKAAFPSDRDLYRADAARLLTAAGKKEEALKIWKELGANLESPALGEAKIRIGELTVAPAGKP